MHAHSSHQISFSATTVTKKYTQQAKMYTLTHVLTHNRTARPIIPIPLHILTWYSFTKTCHSAPHTDSPLQQCRPVNSPYYITMHMHAQIHKQLLNSVGQSLHTYTPYCILKMYFNTHLKWNPWCVYVHGWGHFQWLVLTQCIFLLFKIMHIVIKILQPVLRISNLWGIIFTVWIFCHLGTLSPNNKNYSLIKICWKVIQAQIMFTKKAMYWSLIHIIFSGVHIQVVLFHSNKKVLQVMQNLHGKWCHWLATKW